jgi:hypothetical protein
MKKYGGDGDGEELSASRSDRFILGETTAGTHWTGGWVDQTT